MAGQIGRTASLATGAALLAVAVFLALRRLAPAIFAGAPQQALSAAGAWQTFSEPALAQAIGQGRAVLVDVTADWCINCQVNKALVLDCGWVAEQLATGKILGLKADWTRPDPAIARYLASFGRYGIPFNAVYGPRAQQGLPLPPVLSEGALREAVSQAGGG